MLDWSVIAGIALGLGIPGATGLMLIVRMENRVTTLENQRNSDEAWRGRVEQRLDTIVRDVGRLFGDGHREHGNER